MRVIAVKELKASEGHDDELARLEAFIARYMKTIHSPENRHNSLKKALRRQAYLKQEKKCFWCHKEMIWRTHENQNETWDDPLSCTADHLIPISCGGLTEPSNIVAACRLCNNKRTPRPQYVIPTQIIFIGT